jgi:DNA repair exonuclease
MADVHLHAWSAFSTTLPDGMNSRLAGLLLEIERAALEVKAAGGHIVVIAGDLFHVRGSVKPSVLNPIRDLMHTLGIDHGIQFIVLAGNHDLEGRDATRLSSAVTALEGNDCWVINEPTYIDAIKTLMVPWIENIEELKKTIEAQVLPLERAKSNLIIHAPIDGVIDGLPASGLTPDYLNELGFKRVYAGHYHNHRRFCEGKVVSIGPLAHHTWNEIGCLAGFLLVNDVDFSWRKSHLPEFVDLAKLAETLTDETDIGLMVDGNFVRVKVAATKVKEVEAARKELLDLGARAVLVQAEPAAPIREGTERATVESGASLEVSVAGFAKTQPNPDEVAKAALDILSIVEA